MKIKPNDLIKKPTSNMNNTETSKYQIEPERVEKKSLEDDIFREKFDFYRLEKVAKNHERNKRYMLKNDANKRKLREPLAIGEKVLVLSERLKKKDAPGKLYKPTTQNKSFFNKDKIFIVKKRVKILTDGWYYWVAEENSNKINKFRFVRQELYALDRQWM